MAKTYSFVVQETRSVSVFNEVLLIAAKLAHGEAEAGSSVVEESKLLFLTGEFDFSFFLSLVLRLLCM